MWVHGVKGLKRLTHCHHCCFPMIVMSVLEESLIYMDILNYEQVS